MSDSDDDDLPTLSNFNFLISATKKRTFDELLLETSSLIENLEKEPLHTEQNELLVQETPDVNSLLINDPVLDDVYACDTFEEPSVRLFGENGDLQFFTWDDLSLVKCGLDSTLDLSEQEKLLIKLNEEDLQKEINCSETFSVEKIKQLRSLVQYVFKTMAIHPDEGYVRACQKFIRRTILKWHHIKDFSISYTVIFKVLFNYGVDVQKNLFNVLPGAKDIKRTEIVNEIPRNFVFNLKAVLSSIGDLMKHCKMKEDEFYKVFVYLLWMSLDDHIKINSYLQQCTAIILNRFSNSDWPVWRKKIAQFVLCTYYETKSIWNSPIKMMGCISYEECRGFQLRNYISYLALLKLTDAKSSSNVLPEYSKKLFKVKKLQPILDSICGAEKKLQLSAIKFINLFISSLKLSNKVEHDKLRISLKKCEDSISEHATIQKSKICIIRSRISLMAPPENSKMERDDVPVDEKDYSESESELDSVASSPASYELPLENELEESLKNNDSNELLENENMNSKDCVNTF